jgi:hypothetical protein
MKILVRCLAFSFGILLLVYASCTPPQAEPFLWTKALAGDSRVTVQFWLNDDALLAYGGMLGHFKLMRAEGEGDYEEIDAFGPINPLRATWSWTDTTAENGKTYKYLVHAIFAIFENPEAEGYSDTLVAVPKAGLTDPRPAAPDSFRYKSPLFKDTVELFWNPPDSADDIYYLLYAPPSLEFVTFDSNFDGSGRNWDPGNEGGVEPATLDSAYYKFNCQRDGDTRYYMIYAFRDSIMSYPSDTLEIVHTWQPPSSPARPAPPHP